MNEISVRRATSVVVDIEAEAIGEAIAMAKSSIVNSVIHSIEAGRLLAAKKVSLAKADGGRGGSARKACGSLCECEGRALPKSIRGISQSGVREPTAFRLKQIKSSTDGATGFSTDMRQHWRAVTYADGGL